MLKRRVLIQLVFIFTALYVASLSAPAQSIKEIDSLTNRYQECLDKGQYMLGCTNIYYDQMDSLLNLRYNQLRSACNNKERKSLKKEQLEWLTKRDKQFEENKQKFHQQAVKDGFAGGQDETMMTVDANANFVRQRVMELIRRSPGNYAMNK